MLPVPLMIPVIIVPVVIALALIVIPLIAMIWYFSKKKKSSEKNKEEEKGNLKDTSKVQSFEQESEVTSALQTLPESTSGVSQWVLDKQREREENMKNFELSQKKFEQDRKLREEKKQALLDKRDDLQKKLNAGVVEGKEWLEKLPEDTKESLKKLKDKFFSDQVNISKDNISKKYPTDKDKADNFDVYVQDVTRMKIFEKVSEYLGEILKILDNMEKNNGVLDEASEARLKEIVKGLSWGTSTSCDSFRFFVDSTIGNHSVLYSREPGVGVPFLQDYERARILKHRMSDYEDNVVKYFLEKALGEGNGFVKLLEKISKDTDDFHQTDLTIRGGDIDLLAARRPGPTPSNFDKGAENGNGFQR